MPIFDDQMHIYTRKTVYLHLATLYWGEGGLRSHCVGGEGGLRSNCALKITIVVVNDSLVFFFQFSKVSQLLLTSTVGLTSAKMETMWPVEKKSNLSIARVKLFKNVSNSRHKVKIKTLEFTHTCQLTPVFFYNIILYRI